MEGRNREKKISNLCCDYFLFDDGIENPLKLPEDFNILEIILCFLCVAFTVKWQVKNTTLKTFCVLL